MSVHREMTPDSVDFQALQAECGQVDFPAGERLRTAGQHYQDMYLLVEGAVEVDFIPAGRKGQVVLTGFGQPVGEIGFLHGRPATATVTALRPTRALRIDDATFLRLETRHPAAFASILRRLAEIAEDRTSQNLVLYLPTEFAGEQSVEVLLCRNEEMLTRAQRLRYEVYCEELARRSPFADHEKKVIADELDKFGRTLIAIEAGKAIGTLRGNLPREGPLGALAQLYGMESSPHFPDCVAVCTKFVVRKSTRTGPAALKLMSAMVRLGLRLGVKECFIDCVPSLLPFYKAIGFSVAGPMFLHVENGPSLPMAIDVVKHGARLK
jgi:CRP-like cAMP-binding protein